MIARFAAVSLLSLAALHTAAHAQATYQIDSAHSSAQFSVRHLMVSNVKGSFDKVAGTVVYDPNNVEAMKVEATIDASTVNTGQSARDNHLKTADFFDVAKYPAITFKSKRAWRSNGTVYVAGDLAMHGVSKEVTLTLDGPTPEQKDARGAIHIGATATTKINRKDWGLTYNQLLEAGGVAVSEEVIITIDVEATRQK